MAMIRRIELARDLFMLEVESGQETFITKELSMDHFPHSMRYYDPIVAFVQENIADGIRDLFEIKNMVAFNVHRASDCTRGMMETLGIVESEKEAKLVFQHQAINAK